MELRIADNFSEFAELIRNKTDENINLCYQCQKCTSGCPVADFMDFTPNQLVHAARLGLKEIVLESKTIWLCVSCETCTTRCPQGIDLVKVTSALRSLAIQNKTKPKVPEIAAFYRAALSNIRFYGRMYELGVLGRLKFQTRRFTKDLQLGLKMFKNGKLRLFPTFKGFLIVKRIFRRAKKAEKS